MQAVASVRYVRTSPTKARLVTALIEGKRVNEALNILAFTHRGSARIIEKLLKSAIANAEERSSEKSDIDSFIIKKAIVDGGPVLKRFRPRARGRATRIIKRTSHITLLLEET